jgi:Bacterial regulatory proteins, tetR family
MILFIERQTRSMGIKQHRERERQEIRQRILSAAREIAAEEGWQAVTTRKVAERIEYSQSTIYAVQLVNRSYSSGFKRRNICVFPKRATWSH